MRGHARRGRAARPARSRPRIWIRAARRRPPEGLAVGLIPHATHVNVQLADGALLPDGAGIVEGTGKRIRHVKCRTIEDVVRPGLRTLLEEQASRRRTG